MWVSTANTSSRGRRRRGLHARRPGVAVAEGGRLPPLLEGDAQALLNQRSQRGTVASSRLAGGPQQRVGDISIVVFVGYRAAGNAVRATIILMNWPTVSQSVPGRALTEVS